MFYIIFFVNPELTAILSSSAAVFAQWQSAAVFFFFFFFCSVVVTDWRFRFKDGLVSRNLENEERILFV
jgi:hypothetical protein